jgi:hypothetical protein
MTLKDAIQKAAGQTSVYGVVGKVIAINTTERTCDVAPINDDPILYDVRLQADPDMKNGFVVFPKKGSHVIVTLLDYVNGFVSLCAEVEKMEVVIGSKSLIITNKGVAIKSATSDLKTVLDGILDESENVYDLLIKGVSPSDAMFLTAAGVPCLTNPALVAKATLNKVKIAQLKQAIDGFLTT